MRLTTFAGAAALVLAMTVPALAGAQIQFNRTEYDYGQVQKGGNGTAKFSFSNSGNEPLIVSGAKATGSGVTLNWPKEPVMPGATGTITVQYDTNRVGPIAKGVIVTSNSDEAAPALRISGTVVQ